MKKLAGTALFFLALVALGTPLAGDSCWDCFYGDLCVPLPPGWGFDTCREVQVRRICSFDFDTGLPMYCLGNGCELGSICTIAWDPM